MTSKNIRIYKSNKVRVPLSKWKIQFNLLGTGTTNDFLSPVVVDTGVKRVKKVSIQDEIEQFKAIYGVIEEDKKKWWKFW